MRLFERRPWVKHERSSKVSIEGILVMFLHAWNLENSFPVACLKCWSIAKDSLPCRGTQWLHKSLTGWVKGGVLNSEMQQDHINITSVT